MSRNILVVNGHPDPSPERFCAALCDAYAAGAQARGCAIRRLDVGMLNLPALSCARETDKEPWESIEQAFRLLRAADRLAIVYPLWADGPPVELCQLFDYVARLNAHLNPLAPGSSAKAARVVVTTALPAFLYRTRARDAFAANNARQLSLRGVAASEPVFIGSVDAISCGQRTRWLEDVRAIGQASA